MLVLFAPFLTPVLGSSWHSHGTQVERQFHHQITVSKALSKAMSNFMLSFPTLYNLRARSSKDPKLMFENFHFSFSVLYFVFCLSSHYTPCLWPPQTLFCLNLIKNIVFFNEPLGRARLKCPESEQGFTFNKLLLSFVSSTVAIKIFQMMSRIFQGTFAL